MKRLQGVSWNPEAVGCLKEHRNRNWEEIRDPGCTIYFLPCSSLCSLFTLLFCSSLKVGFLCRCFHHGEGSQPSSWVLRCPLMPSHTEETATSASEVCSGHPMTKHPCTHSCPVRTVCLHLLCSFLKASCSCLVSSVLFASCLGY